MILLRDYQQAAVDGIRREYAAGKKNVVLVLPTGSGKTIIFSYIAKSAQEKGGRVMILVHRMELMRQTVDALMAFGITPATIQAGEPVDSAASICVGMVGTVARRLDVLTCPTLIVVDECHHVISPTYRKIIAHFSDAKTLGVTATPERLDGRGLGAIYDAMIVGPSTAELVELGHLVEPVVYASRSKIDMQGVKTRGGDYETKATEEAVNKRIITGDAVAHYKKFLDGKPALVFCVSVQHARDVAEVFRLEGVTSEALDGTLSQQERDNALNGLKNGCLNVITSCELISEGMDVPAVAGVIMLRPTKSLGLYIQQIGRALRPSCGKTYAIVLDHVGNVFRHGLPDQAREWTLAGVDKKTRAAQLVNIRQCEKCYAIFEAFRRECPECGNACAVKEVGIEVRDGELEKIEKAQLAKNKRAEVGRARTLPELQEIEEKRGYKRGWAQMVWRSRKFAY